MYARQKKIGKIIVPQFVPKIIYVKRNLTKSVFSNLNLTPPEVASMSAAASSSTPRSDAVELERELWTTGSICSVRIPSAYWEILGTDENA